MKAVDTNILARLIVVDDPAHEAIAREFVRGGVFVPLTVLLELGWLLRSRYGFDRARLSATLIGLIEAPGVSAPEPDALRTALEHYAQQGDFADVIHMVASRGTSAFATFDRGVSEIAGLGVPVEQLG